VCNDNGLPPMLIMSAAIWIKRRQIFKKKKKNTIHIAVPDVLLLLDHNCGTTKIMLQCARCGGF
jgi:hypothetical protein